MKGDFTRSSFRPADHYSGVLLQQGRVQVDADWNEQVDIVRHREETTAGHVVGPSGAPMHDAGFALSCTTGDIVTGCAAEAIRIGPGRYYVDGILCENETEVPLHAQPDLPGVALPTTAGTYLAYLDVWQRHVTAFERPELREVALGGPDAATRSRTTWQVRLLAVDADDTCLDFEDGWQPPGTESTGKLRAEAEPPPVVADECLVPAGAGYRRIENQLYRVEIHDGGGAEATYTWSRDNGSLVAGLADIDGMVVTIDAPKDVELRFADARAIELSDEGRVLRGEPGILVAVSEVEGNKITVQEWPGGTGPTMGDFGDLLSVRRWEAAAKATHPTFEGLEDGVQVAFDPGQYRTGDHWLIPARSLDGTVQWPRDGTGSPLPQPRHGIDHHYSPLALLELAGGTWSLKGDCRRVFPPVTELTALRYVSGDGQEVMPDIGDPGKLLPLPEPIRVGVANGRWPVEGARVHFELVHSTGQLAGVDASGDVVTGADGIASCGWSLGADKLTQQVEATLLDAKRNRVGLPVRFTANLSVASNVAYDPGTACPNLQDDRSVQDAIARLSELASIRYVGGDGQNGMPGQTLRPLVVAVSSPCGPVEGATVEFSAAAGNGTLQGTTATVVSVTTTETGLATCTWRLHPTTPSQQVTATLKDAGERTIITPASVTFTAGLNVASLVAYDPSRCEDLAEAGTVQDAIDLLCSGPSGPRVRIEHVELMTGEPLLNDDGVAGSQLAEGIRVVCDRDLDPASIEGKPVCFVTVDLPFPLHRSEVEFWDNPLIGFRPIVVAANVTSDGNHIFWSPADRSSGWLAELVARVRDAGIEARIPVHLTLKGNFIWAGGGEEFAYLDGEAFGVPEDVATRVRFPSGNGRAGGDFEMWFWLDE